jgi:hypothetical protein
MLPPGLAALYDQLQQQNFGTDRPPPATAIMALHELRQLDQDPGFHIFVKRMTTLPPGPVAAPGRCTVCGCDPKTCS